MPAITPRPFRGAFRKRTAPESQAVAACCRFCWKHSRQNTGLPCVGLKGTVVSLPHCEQVVRVSVLLGTCPGVGAPSTETRFALHTLQRFGSFLNCLSWKNNCSPAVKIKSEPQSIHFSILSWNSIPHPIPRPPPVRLRKQELSVRASALRVVTHPPSNIYPGFGPLAGHASHCSEGNAGHGPWRKSSASECETRGKGMGHRPTAATHRLSVLLLASFFATTFPCQRFLDTFFFAGLQVIGVALNLLDNIFLLHLALETSQCVFERFTLLKSDFRQTNYTPKLVPLDPIVIATFRRQVKGECQSFATHDCASRLVDTRLHPPYRLEKQA